MDLSNLTPEQLSTLRQDVAQEQERRRKLTQLPDDLAAMALDAVSAGCDPDDLLDRITDSLTQERDPTVRPPASGE